jgi:hypothetical protein
LHLSFLFSASCLNILDLLEAGGYSRAFRRAIATAIFCAAVLLSGRLCPIRPRLLHACISSLTFRLTFFLPSSSGICGLLSHVLLNESKGVQIAVPGIPVLLVPLVSPQLLIPAGIPDRVTLLRGEHVRVFRRVRAESGIETDLGSSLLLNGGLLQNRSRGVRSLRQHGLDSLGPDILRVLRKGGVLHEGVEHSLFGRQRRTLVRHNPQSFRGRDIG